MMNNTRPSLGFGEELDAFDPKSWNAAGTAPQPKPAHHLETTRQIAEASGFKSREPGLVVPARVDRRRRTGRNAQFNLKAKPETIEAFCRIADAQGWGLGETFEKAVEMLEERFGIEGQ